MNIDTLYQEFTAKVLPQVAAGFQITKEYFVDLFGRYIKYLLVSDGIYFLVSVFFLSMGIYLGYRSYHYEDKGLYDDTGVGLFLLSGVLITFSLIATFAYLESFIKDIYIPEVRVYESLKQTH